MNPLIAKRVALIVGAGFRFNGNNMTFAGDWRLLLKRIFEVTEIGEADMSSVTRSLKELVNGRPVMPESKLIMSLLRV